jgi:hypothetical protein
MYINKRLTFNGSPLVRTVTIGMYATAMTEPTTQILK